MELGWIGVDWGGYWQHKDSIIVVQKRLSLQMAFFGYKPTQANGKMGVVFRRSLAEILFFAYNNQ